MKKKRIQTFFWAALMVAVPVLAGHGPLDSLERDAWIDVKLNDLVVAGLVRKPGKPLSDLTNLEVAQLTREAAGTVVAQAGLPLPPFDDPGLPFPLASGPAPQASTKASLKALIEEYKEDVSETGKGLAALEDRILERDRLSEDMAALQEAYLSRTGLEASGYARGYYHATDVNSWGPGGSIVSQPPSFTDINLMEMRFRSVPVPFNLLDFRMRAWRTVGLYYADPINPRLEYRWLSLNSFNDAVNLTAGDFYKHYTPFTLWNADVPVYTFLEPTSFKQRRKEAEEILFLDHGNDWRMRGFQAYTDKTLGKDSFLHSFQAHAMGGSMKTPTNFRFGDLFAGARTRLGFAEGNLEVGATGLLIWNDPRSANVPYIFDFPSTYAKEYQIGGLDAEVTAPFDDKAAFIGSVEYTGSRYQDDAQDPNRNFEDWAFRLKGALDIEGIKVGGRFLNVGPYFYSPGAQTNRFSSLPRTGYLSTNLFKEDGLVGYVNRFVFPTVDRPTFAMFDRTSENMLPYGEATPNRLGWILDLSGEAGKDGWFKPRASFVLSMKELQPNYVLIPAGNGSMTVDTGMSAPDPDNPGFYPEPPVRTYSGYEGALTMELAKALDMGKNTLTLGLDYKFQKTDLPWEDLGYSGDDARDLQTTTLITTLDFNVPVKGFLEGIVWSLASVWVDAFGREYFLSGGAVPSHAAYHSYLETDALGSYASSFLALDRTTLAFGASYSLSPTIRVRGDLFRTYTSSGPFKLMPFLDHIPVVDTWRFSYEASF